MCKKKAQSTRPKLLNFALLLGQKVGPLDQMPGSDNGKRCSSTVS